MPLPGSISNAAPSEMVYTSSRIAPVMTGSVRAAALADSLVTTVEPVPLGVILMLPLVSVDDNVLESRRRLSTLRIVGLVPISTTVPPLSLL